MDTCIFCKISDKKVHAEIVYEDDAVLAFKDTHPQAPVHIIIIPRRHIPTLNDVAPEDATTIGKMVRVAQMIAKDSAVSDSGYRLVINCNKDAGQAVFHLHMHLIGGRACTWPPG